MYDFNILAVIPCALFIASIVSVLCYCIKNKTFDFELSKQSSILLLLSVLSVFLLVFTGLMSNTYGKNDYREINSSTQKIALNSSKKPIYDIIINNDNFSENSNVEYKFYLKSGKTITVSPKIVHVNQSHDPYLKKERDQKIMHVLWLKFKGPIDTKYTLYLNDK